MKLEKKYLGLRIMSHENHIYMHSMKENDVGQAMQDAVNILALIREDYLGDICPLLEACAELQDLKATLDLQWIVDGFDTYLYGDEDNTSTFWRKTMAISENILRVHVGPRAPMIYLFEEERKNLECEFLCQIGYSEEGNSVLILPSDLTTKDELIDAVHQLCKTVMDVTFLEKPLGVKLYYEKDVEGGSKHTRLTKPVCVKAMYENAKKSALVDGFILLFVNGESVVGRKIPMIIKFIKKCFVPLTLTTSACASALEIICFNYEMPSVMYDLFDWVFIKQSSKCTIKSRFLDGSECQILVGGSTEDVLRTVNAIKAEAEEIETVDIAGISFILHHADCRILNRLKADCNVVTTDINDLRFAEATRIAVRGNFVDRHKFKSYLENVRMNMIDIVCNVPISLDFITNLHHEMGAIVSVHPRDPQMAYIHDGLFHPGTKIRARRLREELRKSPFFQYFATKNKIILGDENSV